MKRTCVPSRGNMVGLLCVSAVLAGCSDDSTGPGGDPAFDPAFAVEVVDEVLGAFEASEVEVVMGNINFALGQAQAAPAAVSDHGLPGAGSTYVYDESDLKWKVDPERTGAPAEGVRFVWYAMDLNANSPIRPLDERGYVDLVLEETSETEARMDVTFVLLEEGAPTVAAEFSILFQEDAGSGSFTVSAGGTAGSVAFDVERSFTFEEQEGLYELLVTVDGDGGLVAAGLEAPFDPVTQEDTGDPLFVGSVLTQGHYLLVETGVELETGALDGTVEADDQNVLELQGTAADPTFRLPTGEAPTTQVQAQMTGVWAELWSLLTDGAVLVSVLESRYR